MELFDESAFWIRSICLVFCLTGCTTAANSFTGTPVTKVAIETAPETAAPILTLTSTPSPAPITPTPVPSTPTLDVPPDARLQFHTLQYLDALPDRYRGEGYMVLLQVPSPQTVIILNLATGERIQKEIRSRYPQEELGIMSLDGKWLIRLANPENNEPETWEYEVFSASGEKVNQFSLPREWEIRDTWINEHQILADKKVNPDSLAQQTMAIDPFTGEQQMLPFDYPDIYDMGGIEVSIENIYDPTLNYVIYPGFIPDAPPGQILRDVKNQTNIVSFPVTTGFGPIWSPDGNWFALGTNRSIFSVSLEGERKSLTHMEKFDRVWIGPRGSTLSWSPNGQKIAFGLLPVPQPTLEGDGCLAILDVATETVTTYCLPDFDIRSGGMFYPLVWAADSKQLLVQGNRISTDTWDFALLINLEDETAINLGERLDPWYFLSSLPIVWMP